MAADTSFSNIIQMTIENRVYTNASADPDIPTASPMTANFSRLSTRSCRTCRGTHVAPLAFLIYRYGMTAGGSIQLKPEEHFFAFIDSGADAPADDRATSPPMAHSCLATRSCWISRGSRDLPLAFLIYRYGRSAPHVEPGPSEVGNPPDGRPTQ